MHSRIDNIEITISDKTDDVIKELFDPYKRKCQNNLESKKGGDLVINVIKQIQIMVDQI